MGRLTPEDVSVCPTMSVPPNSYLPPFSAQFLVQSQCIWPLHIGISLTYEQTAIDKRYRDPTWIARNFPFVCLHLGVYLCFPVVLSFYTLIITNLYMWSRVKKICFSACLTSSKMRSTWNLRRARTAASSLRFVELRSHYCFQCRRNTRPRRLPRYMYTETTSFAI
jgi:hypothetical protein